MTDEEKSILASKLKCIASLFKTTIKTSIPENKGSVDILYMPVTGTVCVTVANNKGGYDLAIEYREYGENKFFWRDVTDEWNGSSKQEDEYQLFLKESEDAGYTVGYKGGASSAE